MSRLIAALAGAAVAVAVVAAQSGDKPQQPQTQQPVFKSRANFVRVDVYPTHNGVPVLDLTADDFEIQEDSAKQAVETFEHVVIRPAGPQDARAEPNTIEAANQQAGNPRSRVFVLFLDAPHVTIEGTWNIREPLIRLIERILGPDDLIGIMLPGMAASDVVLARKTQVLEGGLRNRIPWGERFTFHKDEREKLYEACYPPTGQEAMAGKVVSELATKLTERRRERATLDALNELVQHLHNLREERKAILTVSEGWLLFRPDQSLFDLRQGPGGAQDPIPGTSPITVGPSGRLGSSSPNNVSTTICDTDRMTLAAMDDSQYFRDIINDANRFNASFYTIDPRGLAVWDNPIGPDLPPPPVVDYAMLKTRLEAMRTLAEGTDGMAVVATNDLDKGLKRISDDLTSYYLLGYYSTNQKLDGKYRTLKVRVKRPGVDVRARKGYRAATEKEVMAAATAAAAPVPAILSTIASAVGTLDRLRPGTRFLVNAVPAAAAGKAVSTIWVAGELQPIIGADPWDRGGTADIDITGSGVTGTARAKVAPGERAFVVPVTLSRALESGTLDVRVRLTGPDASADRATDSVSIDLALAAGRPLLFRRGPSTGNRLQPVAAFQFGRTERAHFEVPIAPDVKPVAARLLDKTGQPLAIPVTIGESTDPVARRLQPSGDALQPGDRWLTVDITLAPLAPGDYLVEITSQGPAGEQRTLAAIRVTR